MIKKRLFVSMFLLVVPVMGAEWELVTEFMVPEDRVELGCFSTICEAKRVGDIGVVQKVSLQVLPYKLKEAQAFGIPIPMATYRGDYLYGSSYLQVSLILKPNVSMDFYHKINEMSLQKLKKDGVTSYMIHRLVFCGYEKAFRIRFTFDNISKIDQFFRAVEGIDAIESHQSPFPEMSRVIEMCLQRLKDDPRVT